MSTRFPSYITYPQGCYTIHHKPSEVANYTLFRSLFLFFQRSRVVRAHKFVASTPYANANLHPWRLPGNEGLWLCQTEAQPPQTFPSLPNPSLRSSLFFFSFSLLLSPRSVPLRLSRCYFLFYPLSLFITRFSPLLSNFPTLPPPFHFLSFFRFVDFVAFIDMAVSFYQLLTLISFMLGYLHFLTLLQGPIFLIDFIFSSFWVLNFVIRFLRFDLEDKLKFKN